MYKFQSSSEFLVGFDSDGCVFDTMELKHKECFTPEHIRYWGLQGVSKYAREASEFVNLYSKMRGINRFPALLAALELTKNRPEVIARGVEVEMPQELIDWVERETKLGNPALEAEVKKTNDPVLKKTLDWSVAINDAVTAMVANVPPFQFVRESIQKLEGKADMLVVSATPNEALAREWEEHDLDKYVLGICGQEVGTKAEILEVATKYAPEHTLMVGDAPGDYNAAKKNAALFYPINPGDEDASWKRFYEEGIDKFLAGEFAGDYQQMLLDEFDEYLPEVPPWQR